MADSSLNVVEDDHPAPHRRRRGGHPRLYGVTLQAIHVAVPPDWIAALDAMARARGISRPQLLRELIGNWVEEQKMSGGTASGGGA